MAAIVMTLQLVAKSSDKNPSSARRFGIFERQKPITSAVGASSALQKMLQDFLNQFQAASLMFAKFDLAAL